ncbi:hypothetical protein IFR05_003119 [Cadophora sp. M221]|nr:hypothetical protein IFR05_003119 [Cadophora sp. M221]
MKTALLVPCLLIAASLCSAQTRGISTALLSRFQKISTIALATYSKGSCKTAGGVPKVAEIYNKDTDILAWIMRDDISREIILAFRGTNPSGTQNQKANANTTLGNFVSLLSCAGCKVHGGYYASWLSVVEEVESKVKTQMEAASDYGLVVTGHSLGGAMATIAAAQLSMTYQNLTVFSLGEPRTGNAAFASFIDTRFKTNSPETTTSHRSVHENDPVTQNPSMALGYMHHGLEVWNRDPTGVNTSYFCGGETMLCSGSQGNSTVKNAHGTYWGRGFVECS